MLGVTSDRYADGRYSKRHVGERSKLYSRTIAIMRPRVHDYQPLAALGVTGDRHADNGYMLKSISLCPGGIVSLLTQVIVTDTRQIHVWEPLSFRLRRQHNLFTRKDIA